MSNAWLHMELPIEIEEKDGLFFITSPLLNGLLVAERSEALALEEATRAIHRLAEAATAEKHLGRMPWT